MYILYLTIVMQIQHTCKTTEKPNIQQINKKLKTFIYNDDNIKQTIDQLVIYKQHIYNWLCCY